MSEPDPHSGPRELLSNCLNCWRGTRNFDEKGESFVPKMSDLSSREAVRSVPKQVRGRPRGGGPDCLLCALRG